MQREEATDWSHSANHLRHQTADTQRGISRSETIHIRNYDHQRAYDFTIEIVSTHGETVFRERYYVLPGHTESECGAVPIGDYEVHVTVDNGHSKTLSCRLDATPDHTAVIEAGNGAFALTEGLQS